MSSSAIDQFLQVAVPASPAASSAVPPKSDGPAFQEHLQRASSAAPRTEKQAVTAKQTETEAEEEDSISSTDEQQAAASQQEESTSSTESAEAVDTEAAEKDSETSDSETEEGKDEVVVSDAAAKALVEAEKVTDGEESAPLATVAPEEQQTEEEDSESTDKKPQQVDSINEIATENNGEESADAVPASEAEPVAGSLPEQEVNFDDQVEVAIDASGKQPVATTADEPLAESEEKSQPAKVRDHASETRNKHENSEEPKQTAQDNLVVDEEETSSQSSQDLTESQDASADRKADSRQVKPQQPAANVESPVVKNDLQLESVQGAQVAAGGAESVTPSPPTLTSTHSPTANLSLSPTENGAASTPAAPAQGDAAAEPTSTVDRVRFAQRVGNAIRSAQNRDGQIQLRLSPPELGSLRIEITAKLGVLTARLEAETPAARTVLLDSLPLLRERLAEHEIRIEKFDVDVRDEGSQHSDNTGSDNRHAPRSPREPRSPHHSHDKHSPEITKITTQKNTATSPSGLDVRI
ncbi:MAG: flagellar hook-length control protein FliK [Planctomycetales bacterium]|nr:flagellar hook-length control protein FliK [Planctomycetales bacterium]